MKKLKYIALVILLISLLISSFPHVLSGFSLHISVPDTDFPIEAGELEFLEAYTFGEFSSALGQDHPVFQMIDSEDRSTEGSKLGFCTESKISETWDFLHNPAFLKELPKDLRFAWGADQGEKGKYLYALKDPGTAYAGPEQSDIKEIGISEGMLLISFSKEGSKKWAALTKNSVGRAIAIVHNDIVYSTPVVREVIKDGKCAISGNFSESDLIALKAVLEN